MRGGERGGQAFLGQDCRVCAEGVRKKPEWDSGGSGDAVWPKASFPVRERKGEIAQTCRTLAT